MCYYPQMSGRDPLGEVNQELLESAFLNPYRNGEFPADLRSKVLKAFKPYTRNHDFLENNAWIWLTQEWIEFQLISPQKQAVDLLNELTGVYHKSFDRSNEKSLGSAFFWLEKMYTNATVSNAWLHDLLIRRNSKEFSNPEKEIYDCFSDLSTLIEGIGKPFLHAIFEQSALSRADNFLPESRGFNLGKLVAAIDQSLELRILTRPGKWELKINDWRNIADHYSWEPKDVRITCRYGKGNENSLILDKEELRLLVDTVLANTTAVMLAHRLFCVDNTRQAKDLNLLPSVEPNIKVKQSSIRAMLSAMGFHVVQVQLTPRVINLTIKNALQVPDVKRLNELFPAAILGSHLQADSLIRLIYLDRSDKPMYEISYDVEGIKELLRDRKQKITVIDYIRNATFKNLN